MAKKLYTRVQNKRDLEANWNLATGFIPLEGELIIYSKEVDDTGKTLTLPSGRTKPYTYDRFKLGDGKTLVTDLPFAILPLSGNDPSDTFSKIDGGLVIGDGEATGISSIAGGSGTIASAHSQTALGKYNAIDDDALFIVGNGTSDTDRQNAFVVKNDGTVFAGDKKLATKEELTGKKTSEGGEIFNDYECNIAGGRGFVITETSGTEGGTGTYTLRGYADYVASVGKFYAIGSSYSVILDDSYGLRGTITDINGDVITVNNYVAGKKSLAEIVSSNSNDESYTMFWVSNSPDVGNCVLSNLAHAEGRDTKAIQQAAHAEGRQTIADGKYSHAEGRKTKAVYAAHAEGHKSEALEEFAHAEGEETKATGQGSHAEGYRTNAIGKHAHAEGNITHAKGDYSHAEGQDTHAEGLKSHTEGHNTYATQEAAHAEGMFTYADSKGAHAEGFAAHAEGDYSHAEGSQTSATELGAHAEGLNTSAEGQSAHAEGEYSSATKKGAHAEGLNTKAEAEGSHTEGYATHTEGAYAHAEGSETKATKVCAHAEGYKSEATGDCSHAEGSNTIASGNYSHASGYRTQATAEGQTVVGKFNETDDNALFIVGNGNHNVESGVTTLSNAFVVKNDGTAFANGKELTTKEYVDTSVGSIKIPDSNKSLVFDRREQFDDWLNPNIVTIEPQDGVTINNDGTLNLNNVSSIYIVADLQLDTKYIFSTNNDNLKLSMTIVDVDTSTGMDYPYYKTYSNGETVCIKNNNTSIHSIVIKSDMSITANNVYIKIEKMNIREDGLIKEDLNIGDIIIIEDDNHYYWDGSDIVPLTPMEELNMAFEAVMSEFDSVKSNIDDIVETSVGKETAEGGEIFNDYENNMAGSMCYTITDLDAQAKTYTLDSTEGLSVGDVYSVHLYYGQNSSSQAENVGVITNIENNTVTVDTFYIQEGKTFVTKESYIDENGLDKEHNTFRIIEKPLVGNRYIGYYSHAENSNTQALSKGAHAEGNGTKAYGSWSHAEGRGTQAGYSAHAEGCGTKAKGFGSHAEGKETIAKGSYSHTEGSYTDANGENSHAGGYNSMATGKNSFTHGDNVKAYFENQVVFGKFNTEPKSTSRFIIGNGIDKENPSNLFEITDDKVIHNNEKLLKTDDVNTMLKDYTPTNNLVYGYRVSNAENVPTGSNCFNSKSGHNITGIKSNAFGERHTIAANASNAFGSNNTINNNASNSIVNGDGNTANTGNSLISGLGLTGYLNNQTVLGQYNNPTRNTAFDPVLIVGGGDSVAKKDIMALKRYKGDLWVAGDVLVGGTDTGHTDAKILATQEYVDGKIAKSNKSLVFNTKENLEGFINGTTNLYCLETCTDVYTPEDWHEDYGGIVGRGGIQGYNLPEGIYTVKVEANGSWSEMSLSDYIISNNSDGTITYSIPAGGAKGHWVWWEHYDQNETITLTMTVQIVKGNSIKIKTEYFEREDGITKENLNIGDLLLVEEENVPDYYWNGTDIIGLLGDKQIATQEYVDNKTRFMTQSEFDTVDTSTLAAGTVVFITE